MPGRKFKVCFRFQLEMFRWIRAQTGWKTLNQHVFAPLPSAGVGNVRPTGSSAVTARQCAINDSLHLLDLKQTSTHSDHQGATITILRNPYRDFMAGYGGEILSVSPSDVTQLQMSDTNTGTTDQSLARYQRETYVTCSSSCLIF